jgi:hypothetical protein
MAADPKNKRMLRNHAFPGEFLVSRKKTKAKTKRDFIVSMTRCESVFRLQRASIEI